MKVQASTPISNIHYTAGYTPPRMKAMGSFYNKPEFLNDPHNVKMFSLIDKMNVLRDKITGKFIPAAQTSNKTETVGELKAQLTQLEGNMRVESSGVKEAMKDQIMEARMKPKKY